MHQTPIQKTRTKLARIYGVGMLVFAAIIAFITVFASFLAHLNLG